MARRSLFSFLIAIATAVIAGGLLAAVVTVKSGVIENVSPDGKTLTVRFKSGDEATELTVAGEIDVLLDGKHAELTAIKPGMSVTVQIDGGVAQRIIAHKFTPKATARPSKPKSTAKTTTTRKPKQTARKSKSGNKEREPNALDALPVATTPLAGLQNAPAGKKNGPSALDSLPVAATPLTGSKSLSGGKTSGPSALDSLPVATTPLAGSKSP